MTTNEPEDSPTVKLLAEKLYNAFWRAVARAALTELRPPPATVERVTEVLKAYDAFCYSRVADDYPYSAPKNQADFAPEAVRMLGVVDSVEIIDLKANVARAPEERDAAIAKSQDVERRLSFERDAAISRANESDRIAGEWRDRALQRTVGESAAVETALRQRDEAKRMLVAAELQLRALRDTVVQCTVALRNEVDAPSTA
jgi:hypothetical protein